jgi:UDP-N-acetylglucosamine 2-epimerase (non-hydrolysing)
MKVAPLHRAFVRTGTITSRIVHTGQHYDARMSDIFFRQLEMPEPDVYLGIGSGSHAQQTARVMTAFEEVLLQEKPDLVLVVGDVNSTLACSLVAAKCHVPVAHVEAGLRSGDRTMPEEINRIVTDSISDYLFVTEQSGLDNLYQEGVPPEKVFFVGNVMIDALVQFRARAAQTTVLDDLKVQPRSYVLMTMHRPSNVDREDGLRRVFETVQALTERHKVVFPLHPRTRQRLNDFGFGSTLEAMQRVVLTEPLGYLEFLRLMENAAAVVTDSGGIQEETTYLGVPCITLRENTERPVTVDLGTNELMALDPRRIARRVSEVTSNASRKARQIPPLWDGRAAERIAEALLTLHARASRAA